MADQPLGRPQNRVYREIFINHHGAPPYRCHYCDGEMMELEHVHHLDEDPWNQEITNLKAAHAFCHNSEHHTDMVHTDETKARISATIRGRMESMTPAERSEKYGHHGPDNPFYGKTHSDETKAKIAAYISSAPRDWCEQCQRDWPHSTWQRHIRKYHDGGKW